ncbi:hypothetical protein F5Y12DRAFT_721377 [Xylaria sp. FL1777]|nr:hypothetical protein F5Y12DRAFT_721377 [Xylaria sp. FL1777]
MPNEPSGYRIPPPSYQEKASRARIQPQSSNDMYRNSITIYGSENNFDQRGEWNRATAQGSKNRVRQNSSGTSPWIRTGIVVVVVSGVILAWIPLLHELLDVIL